MGHGRDHSANRPASGPRRGWAKTVDDVGRAEEGARPATARAIPNTPGGIGPPDAKGVIMRFGYWRGVTLALALGSLIATGFASTASAQGIFHPTIPAVAPAVNVNTGEPMYAPPVPYGHYAKDPIGCIHGKVGCLKCKLGLGGGLLHGHGKACGNCGGAGCDNCGGGGGLFHGHGHGLGGACDNCGGMGCGLCGGHGGTIIPSKTLPSPQACDSCGGGGCGLCGGLGHKGGLFHGHGDPCGSCGGKGCGLFHGGHGNACSNCGGAGCGLCHGGGLGKLHGLVGSALHPHAGRVQYFVGPGGPVPLTPGYVPYVVPTRSPRDFFAFPPFSPDVP